MEHQANEKYGISLNLPLSSVEDLRKLLSLARCCEVWLEGQTAPYGSLCLLINGDRAFVMYLRYPGDAGFHALDPNYGGPEGVMLNFYMKNGQDDHFPIAETIPTEEALRVAEYVFTHGDKPSWITWQDDSNSLIAEEGA